MIKIVSFPNLGLSFNISPVAFNIFNISIYWYGIILVIGYLIGVILIKINDGLYEIKWEQVIEVLTFAILFGIIGARLYYVLFNLDYYSNNLNQIFNISNGGIAIYGGLITGVITIFVFSNIYKYKFLDMLDYIVPFVALGQAIGRFGNFFNIEAYGDITDTFLKMRIFDNITNEYIDVHPTFLYESILTLTIFLIIYINRKNRKFQGQQTLIYLMLYGFGRSIIEQFRIDSLMLGDIKISQLLSIILCIFSIILLTYNLIKTKLKKVK